MLLQRATADHQSSATHRTPASRQTGFGPSDQTPATRRTRAFTHAPDAPSASPGRSPPGTPTAHPKRSVT
jgi:hypothetical protein